MAGPRDRSRHRGMETQQQYEMQNIETSQRSPTAEGSTAYGEDSYGDRNHDHPQNSGAQRLGRRILRTCKERSAGVLRMCKGGLAKHRIMTILTASAICILFIGGLWAFGVLNRSADPSDYGLDWDIGPARGHYQSTRTVTHPTVYRIVTVHYQQFYGARPVHHQAPIAVSSNLEATGQVVRQDLSHPNVVKARSTAVSGLYFIPISVTNGGWPQTQQDSHSSSRSANNTEGSRILQRDPSLEDSEPEAKPLLESRETGASRNLVAGQVHADTISFTRWGVEVLYDLRHRSIPLDKGWCIKNACSPHKQLSPMCNTNKTISDPFRKQECEWCWPENQRKHQEINNHCSEVSKRALKGMLIICGIFLFCTLFIAIVLATRMFRHRRRAKADRVLHKHAATASPLQEKIISIQSHWVSHGMSKFGRSSKAAKIRVDDIAIRKRSPGETVGLTPWYRPVFAKSGERWRIGPENPAAGRSRLQKQRMEPVDQDIAVGAGALRERVPVLPPAPPAISSRVFSDIENMGQGRLLSDPGTNNSQHDPQGMPRRSSRQSRAISSGSEQSASGATHRQDAGAGLYNLQRLTERS